MKKTLLTLTLVMTLVIATYLYATIPKVSRADAHRFFKSEITKPSNEELIENLETSYCERELDETNDKAFFYLCHVDTSCEERMTMLIHNGAGKSSFLAWSGDSPERLLAYTCPEMIPDFNFDNLYRGG